jgi:agmatinase
MWNPLEQWRSSEEGRPIANRPRTFGDRPFTERADELWGADVVVLGAPVDARVTGRPGARGGPHAIAAASFGPGWNTQAGLASFGTLAVVDYGDVPVGPLDDPATVFAAIHARVADVLAVSALPLLMGGDHSVSAPAVAACAEAHGPVGLVHLDAHADVGRYAEDVPPHHAAFARWLVDRGHVDPTRCVQIGLRGYWPGPEDQAWQDQVGMRRITMEEVLDRGHADVVAEVLRVAGTGPTYLTIDLDVVDPAFAPSVGTPEPGGMTSAQALRLVREVARGVPLVGADVVELIGGSPAGDPSAALAERLLREVLTGRVLATTDAT